MRAALLDAAEAILERDGIDALTLRATAREAGVSHAAPAHHFGNLTGLLSALAASGLDRFHDCLQAGAEAASSNSQAHVTGLSRGYLEFAQTYPGLFQLMFRSERLDWSYPALAASGAAAFELLMHAEATPDTPSAASGFHGLAAAMTRWSLIHGLATLLIDGRLEAVAARVLPGTDIARLIEEVLRASHRGQSP